MTNWRGCSVLFLLTCGLLLAGCSSQDSKALQVIKIGKLDPFAGTGSPYYKGTGRVPRGGGRVHIGKPYQVAGRWFRPHEQPGYDKKGVASWYGEAFHRRKTSNGEFFDMAMLTAAHATLPLPSYAKVTNLSNGKSVIVRINDRGPFVDTRVIDLSKRSAEVLDYKNKGKTNVRVQWLGMAPVNDQGGHLAMMNKQNKRGASIRTLVAAAEGSANSIQVASIEEPQADAIQEAAYEPTRIAKPKAQRGAAYVIQVGSFSNPENADAVRDSLSSYGAVQVFQVAGAEDALYQVQLGPFLSGVGAQDALDAVRQAGFPEAILSKTRIEQVSSR